jgi:hypothetical protein
LLWIKHVSTGYIDYLKKDEKWQAATMQRGGRQEKQPRATLDDLTSFHPSFHDIHRLYSSTWLSSHYTAIMTS